MCFPLVAEVGILPKIIIRFKNFDRTCVVALSTLHSLSVLHIAFHYLNIISKVYTFHNIDFSFFNSIYHFLNIILFPS